MRPRSNGLAVPQLRPDRRRGPATAGLGWRRTAHAPGPFAPSAGAPRGWRAAAGTSPRLRARAGVTCSSTAGLPGFRRRALSAGIWRAPWTRPLPASAPDPDILQREAHQPEFSRPIWAYLDSAVSRSRIENGQRALRENRRVLDEIEARYGVDREVVVAVWGMESAYGTLRGRRRSSRRWQRWPWALAGRISTNSN